MSVTATAPPTASPVVFTTDAHANFMPLSELAHQPVTWRDLAMLLPAVLLSLLLNALFMWAMVWYNAKAEEALQAGKIKKVAVTAEEKTTLEQQAEIDQPIDVSAIELDVTVQGSDVESNIPEAELMETPVPPAFQTTEKDPTGVGSGTEMGIQGEGLAGAPGVAGAALIGELGRTGDMGAGLRGEGIGLGGGGGSNQAGGFGLRGGNLGDIAARQGGNAKSEQAVAMGLVWLRKHQLKDGRWALDRYHTNAAGCDCRLPIESGAQQNDTAATALALLPMLGAGHTHKRETTFKKTVWSGLQYLLARQDSRGDFGGTMYGHGLAAIAMCEAYAMTKDPMLKSSAQRAIKFIEYAQNPATGGWRYYARTDGDTSVVGWQVMALRSAQMADLVVSPKSLELAGKWLDACQVKQPRPGNPGKKFTLYQYIPKEHMSPALAAAGLLNRQYLGWGRKHPDLLDGADYLLTMLPPERATTPQSLQLYYWYYASQVMHHMGGDHWQKWNSRMRDLLINTQEKEGHKAGSWSPLLADHGREGGRLYATSMAVLTLEVYYRHLPLYRRDEEAGNVAAAPEKKEEKKAEMPMDK
jgi:hypothetical protein